MNLADEIRNIFANLTTDYVRLLDQTSEKYPSWAIKFKDSYAVAIEIDKEIKINESFANVSYYTDHFIIDGENKYLLILSSSEIQLRNEFAGICAIFLEKGENGLKRKAIQKNPLQWWLKWKELIGNKSVDSSVHGVLGELIALYWVKKEAVKNISAENWTGPEGKSTDITTKTLKVEVKTSLIKYNNIVTISGQFQLDSMSNMSLIYVKLEETRKVGHNIVSIDKMIDFLSDQGMDKIILNKKVEKMGFKKNSMDRKRTYRLLKINEYPINEKFPVISMDSLKDDIDKDRILQLTYKIELAGLENEEIKLDLG